MYKQQAFTLIELLMVVVIGSILMTVGIGQFSTMTQNNRRAAEVNSFVTSLTLARTEAVKRNSTISVCTSKNGTSCTLGSDTDSARWELGSIVFVNSDGDSPPVVDGGELVLRIAPPVSGDITVRGTGDFTTAVSYQSNGFPANVPLGGGMFKFCDDRGATSARAVIISSTGRSRLSQDGTDADDTHEDAGGTNLTCP